MLEYKTLPVESRKFIRDTLINHNIKFKRQTKLYKRDFSEITIEHINQLIEMKKDSTHISTVGMIKKLKSIIRG